MKNQNTKPITKTVVTYRKNGVTYSHPFAGNLLGGSAEAKAIMELKIGRSQIVSITHE